MSLVFKVIINNNHHHQFNFTYITVSHYMQAQVGLRAFAYVRHCMCEIRRLKRKLSSGVLVCIFFFFSFF